MGLEGRTPALAMDPGPDRRTEGDQGAAVGLSCTGWGGDKVTKSTW